MLQISMKSLRTLQPNHSFSFCLTEFISCHVFYGAEEPGCEAPPEVPDSAPALWALRHLPAPGIALCSLLAWGESVLPSIHLHP